MQWTQRNGFSEYITLCTLNIWTHLLDRLSATSSIKCLGSVYGPEWLSSHIEHQRASNSGPPQHFNPLKLTDFNLVLNCIWIQLTATRSFKIKSIFCAITKTKSYIYDSFDNVFPLGRNEVFYLISYPVRPDGDSSPHTKQRNSLKNKSLPPLLSFHETFPTPTESQKLSLT
jgi:hypothetical protein